MESTSMSDPTAAICRIANECPCLLFAGSRNQPDDILAILRWLDRFRALPGVRMQVVPPFTSEIQGIIEDDEEFEPAEATYSVEQLRVYAVREIEEGELVSDVATIHIAFSPRSEGATWAEGVKVWGMVTFTPCRTEAVLGGEYVEYVLDLSGARCMYRRGDERDWRAVA